MGICVAKDIDEGDRIAALDDISLIEGEDSYQAPPSYYSDRQETRCGPTPGYGPNDIKMGPPLSMKPGEQQSLFIQREADEEVLSAHQMLREIDRLRELVQNINDDGIGLRDLVDSEDMYLGDTSAKKSEVRKSLSRRSHNDTLEESSIRLRSSSKFQANASVRSSASNSPFNSSLPPSQVVTPNQSPRKKPKTNSTRKAEVKKNVVKRDTTDSRKRKDLGFRSKDKKWKPYKPDKHTRDPSNSHWLAPRIPKLKEPGKVPRKLGPRDIGRNKSTPYDFSKHPLSKSSTKPPKKNLKVNTESSVEISRSYSDQTISSGNIGSPKRGTKLLNKSKKKKKRQLLGKLKEESPASSPRKVKKTSSSRSRKKKENVNSPPPPTIVIQTRKKETKAAKRLKLKQSGPPRKKKKLEKDLETPPKKLATLTKKKIDLPKKIKKIQLPSKLRNSQKKLPPEDSTPKPRVLQRMPAVPTVRRKSSDLAIEPTTKDDIEVQADQPSRKKSLNRRSMEILETLDEVPNDDNFEFDLAQLDEQEHFSDKFSELEWSSLSSNDGEHTQGGEEDKSVSEKAPQEVDEFALYQRQFDLMDLDKRGYITVEDAIPEASDRYGYDVPERALMHIWGRERLDFKEYVKYMQRDAEKVLEDRCMIHWVIMEENWGRGRINIPILSEELSPSHGINLTKAQRRKLLNRTRPGRGGFVAFPEFKRVFLHTPVFADFDHDFGQAQSPKMKTVKVRKPVIPDIESSDESEDTFEYKVATNLSPRAKPDPNLATWE